MSEDENVDGKTDVCAEPHTEGYVKCDGCGRPELVANIFGKKMCAQCAAKMFMGVGGD
jgi:hypothetical protein